MVPPTGICAVCDKLTSMRCLGCAGPSYCSRTCQTYVWSTHKWFCKPDEAERHTFSFPPLSSGRSDWLSCIDRVNWYYSEKNAKGMRADLLRNMQKPKAASIPEPERSYILALLNETYYTFRAATDRSTGLNESAAGPFHMTGLDVSTIIRYAFQHDCLNRDFFRVYNEFFQEILLFHTVGLTNKVPNEIRANFTRASSARLTEMAQHQRYDDPKLKEAFVSCAERCAHTATACTIM
ncbi:hypothetical protein JCM3774_005489 [Rhodotorula dairenensis]